MWEDKQTIDTSNKYDPMQFKPPSQQQKEQRSLLTLNKLGKLIKILKSILDTNCC
jgi:hypothetical protein